MHTRIDWEININIKHKYNDRKEEKSAVYIGNRKEETNERQKRRQKDSMEDRKEDMRTKWRI